MAARVASVLDPGEGTFLLRLDGGPLEARYKLLVHVVPPCPDGDDDHEDNDVVEDAVDLSALASPDPAGGGAPGPQGEGPQTMLLRICPGDEDWFRFETAATATSWDGAAIAFWHEEGDLDLELFDSHGELLAVSGGIDDHEWVELEGLTAGAYFLRVSGFEDASNPDYWLTLNTPEPTESDSLTDTMCSSSTATCSSPPSTRHTATCPRPPGCTQHAGPG